jgi:ribulose-phosphate 3-epimerase
MKNKIKMSCSLWSADLSQLKASLSEVEEYCDSFHFDIMDGHFVPNLLFGPDIVKALRGLSKKPFEVHLMVNNPETMINLFDDTGADVFIIHPETCKDAAKTIHYLKSNGKKVGIALKVEEELEKISAYLSFVDYVVVMGTKIGIKGVSISPGTYEKVRLLKEVINKNNYRIEVQVDGGIRKDTVPKLYESGADIITAGSLLFNNYYQSVYTWLQNL